MEWINKLCCILTAHNCLPREDQPGNEGAGTGVVTDYKVYTYEGDDAASHDIAWAGGSDPTLTTTASKSDIISILWDKHLEKAYGTITHNF